jgi:hypothetical protein
MTSPADTAALTAAAVDGAGVGAAAGTTGLAAHAAALQTVLADLSTLTLSQLVEFFHKYSSRPDFADLLKAALPQIVLPHANASATVTAQWYNELDPSSSFAATPVVNLSQGRMDGTLGWALYAPTGYTTPFGEDDSTVGIGPDFVSAPILPTADETLSRLAGSTKRMVYDASRDTVVTNAQQQGVRWARVAQPNACAFCRMLATKSGSSRALYTGRGVQVDPETGDNYLAVVGRSPSLSASDRKQRAAGLATTDELLSRRADYGSVGTLRGSQELGEKYHDHCRCTAVPVPDGQVYEAPDYTAQWSQDYKDAVKSAKASGQSKGKYGAVDFKAVLAHMRTNTDAH